MLIRDADGADWPEIWPFFRDIVQAGETYAYPEHMTSGDAEGLWMQRAPGRTVVVIADDEIVGSATMGPNRPGRGSHIATASFMVPGSSRGRGVGRALGENVIRWARDSAYRGIQFNAVVETNVAATTLWQSLGFEIMTTIPGAFEHRTAGPVGLHVMFRPL